LKDFEGYSARRVSIPFKTLGQTFQYVPDLGSTDSIEYSFNGLGMVFEGQKGEIYFLFIL
jgi:hypothetical protein